MSGHAVLGNIRRVYSHPTSIHIWDPPLVQCSTTSAMDMTLALKASATASIPLAWKASEQTCLESKRHGIDSCLR